MDGNGSNQAYGLDAAFSFYDNVNLLRLLGADPDARIKVGDDQSYQVAFNYAGRPLYGLQVDHLLVGDHFNPEVGFKRRDRRVPAAPTPWPATAPGQASIQRRPAVLRWEGSLDYIENPAGLCSRAGSGLGGFATELENSDRRRSIDMEERYDYVPNGVQGGAGWCRSRPVTYQYRSLFLSYSLGQQRRAVRHRVTLEAAAIYHGDITAIGYSARAGSN